MTNSEKQLFEDLSIEHMDSLYTNAIRLARSTIGAEYLVQKTYAYAFCFFDQYDKNSNFNNWLNEILIIIYTNVNPYVQAPIYTSLVEIEK